MRSVAVSVWGCFLLGRAVLWRTQAGTGFPALMDGQTYHSASNWGLLEALPSPLHANSHYSTSLIG